MGFMFFCFSFVLSFVLWWVLYFYAFIKLRNFFISKNLIIIFKLSTIENFYYIEKDFDIILVFLSFCHSLREITKEEEYK